MNRLLAVVFSFLTISASLTGCLSKSDNAFFIGCHPMLKQEHLQYAIDTIDEYLK